MLREHLALALEDKQKVQDKIVQLESDLDQSHSRTLELEREVKVVRKKISEQEELAVKNEQRCLVLEYQIQVSDSKAKKEGKRVEGLEQIAKTLEQKRNELEEHCSSMKTKYVEVEEECWQYSSKTSEVSAELDVSLAKILNLEVSLKNAKEKEMELMENRRELVEERSKLLDTMGHLTHTTNAYKYIYKSGISCLTNN
ncbi:uncharacterized protein LOC116257113 [Nymphaea colorata]|uniref:uncharacterized protein LOC116257113 n=1 Tax=Nymphaea colorata TaxID=210225 RepID=UPI00129DBA9A|nr:uncharacterized protein LOC116257113 [Nymphaea colorata]